MIQIKEQTIQKFNRSNHKRNTSKKSPPGTTVNSECWEGCKCVSDCAQKQPE